MARMGRHLRERLIDEVHRCPILYDTKHLHHRDGDMRDRAWLEIAERLGENTETLKREWKILRDSLRQALKKRSERKLNGEPSKPWYFEHKMAFLKPYMTKRPHYRYRERAPGDAEGEGAKADDDYFEAEAADHPDHPDAVEAVEVGRADAFWEPGDGDGLELFFASASAAARRLPRRLQARLKRQVLEALLQAEEEAERADSKEDVPRAY